MAKPVIYIICHNDETEHAARQIPFGTPIRISGSNKLFESQVFELIDKRQEEWINAPWVGIVTHSFKRKIGDIDIPGLLGKYEGTDIDVVSLFNLDFVKPRVNRPVPFFESVAFQMGASCWTAIITMLRILSYRDEEIMNPKIQGFFSNYWIARPIWMRRYIDFFKKCKKITDTHPTVKECMKADGYYGGQNPASPAKLTEIFGRPIYEMTPFLFERLPCFFFGMEGAKLARDGITIDWQLLD